MFLVTMENNREFKQLSVLSLEVGSLKNTKRVELFSTSNIHLLAVHTYCMENTANW